jgi:hypothetical protein
MAAATITLNPGAGGANPLVDTLATVDSGAAPASASVQMVKVGHGAAGDFKTASVTNPLPIKITDGTTTQGFRPDGFSRSAIDPTTLLFDTFELLDAVNTWTTGGTAPTAPGGSLIVAAGTAASALSYLVSKPSFTPGSNALLQTADLVTLQASVITGAKCIWGLGVVAGTPTAALPLSNGVVFEILDTDGALYGAVYSGTVRTQQVALTRPADGLTHRYAIYYKNSRVYFEIDNVAVGSVGFPNPTVGAMKRVIGTFNGLAVVGTAPTLTASLLGLADSGKNSIKIADGLFPWRMQTVKDASSPAAASDLAAVVALSPNSPVTQATLTKAVQGATGVTTQDLKDAGRSARTITLDSFAVAATAETLNTMSYSTDNATLTTGTSYTVTAGKRFRLQAIMAALHTIAGNTTAVSVIVRLRVNNAGAGIVTSPVQMVIPIAGVAAANQSVGPDIIPIPDGWEFVAGAGLAITTACPGFVATTAAPKVDIALIGYEY